MSKQATRDKAIQSLSALALVIAVVFSAHAYSQKAFSGVLISEIGKDIGTGNREAFEVTNLGPKPVDIAGWTAVVYDGTVTNPDTTHNISGKVLDVGETYWFVESPDVPLTSGYGKGETTSSTITFSSSGGVVLYDTLNNIVDAVFCGSINAGAISSPSTVGAEWTTNTGTFPSGARSWQRTGDTDSDTGADWVSGGQTLGFLNPNLEPRTGSVWDGEGADGDWNNPENWGSDTLPDALGGVTIPDAAAWVSPNVPRVPAEGATVLDLAIEAGGQLDMSAGDLTVLGEFTNAGAITTGSGRFILAGSADQTITSGGRDLGNVHIANTAGVVSLADDWTNVQTGELTSVEGSRLILDRLFNDFTNTTGTLEGDVHIQRASNIFIGGDPDVGTGAPGIILGHATIAVPDPLDIATILGVVGFKSLTLSGSGLIELGAPGGISQNPGFTGVTGLPGIEMPELGDFQAFLTSPLVIAGDVLSGNGHFQHTHARPITVTGDLNVGSLTYDVSGTADLTVNGELSTVGDMRVLSDGAVTCGLPIAVGDDFEATAGTILVNTANLPVASVVAGDATIGGAATMSVGIGFGAPLSIGGTFSYRSSGDFIASGLQATGDVEMDGTGAVTLNFGGLSGDSASLNTLSNNIIVNGFTDILANLSVSGTGQVTLLNGIQTQDLSVGGSVDLQCGSCLFTGDIESSSAGSVNLGVVFAQGADDQQVAGLNATGAGVIIERIVVESGSNTRLLGSLDIEGFGIGPGAEALLVEQGATLTLTDDLEVVFSASTTAKILVQGALTSAPQGNPSRPYFGGVNGAGFAVDFESTARISVTGLKLDNVVGIAAAPPKTAGVIFRAGSRVTAFNNVEIDNATTASSAVYLGTTDLPSVFLGFDVFGTLPSAIDASSIAGLVVEIRKGELTLLDVRQDSRFLLEDDPANVLVWEDPDELVIGGDATLPSAQIEQPYLTQFSATGGNRPYSWSLANAPAWLSVEEDTGILTGVPPFDASGVVQFAVSVSDVTSPARQASKAIILEVEDLVSIPLQITTLKLQSAEEGENYGFALTAAGGVAPYRWTLLSDPQDLPQGIKLTESGGIVGFVQPGARGTYQMRLRVSDSRDARIDRNFTMTVTGDQDNLIQVGIGGAGSESSCSVATNPDNSRWQLLVLLGLLMAVIVLRRRESAKA